MAGSDENAMTVAEMVQWTIRQCNSTKANTGRYPAGPLYTFLIGAGFSASAGVPGTAHLVATLEEFDRKGAGDWAKLLDETAGRTVAGSVEQIGERYFALMDKVLQGPVARQAFITAAVQWAARKQVQISMESVLLASILLAGAPATEDLSTNPGERAWLRGAFAKRAYTTNFDEVIPTTFYLGNQPVDVLDGPSQRPMSESFPSLVYLHGRHLHYDLRNTREEVSRAGAPNPEIPGPFAHFREALRHTGLIVIGYAGAEDRVMRCIETALSDPSSLLLGLWWCAFPGAEALHQRARALVGSSDRARYLEPGSKADAAMEALSDEVGLGWYAAMSAWHQHADRTQKLMKKWLAAQQVEALEFMSEASRLRARFRGAEARALLARRVKVQPVAEAGGPSLAADFLYGVAELLALTDQRGPAGVAYDRALALHRKLGDRRSAAYDLAGLGSVHLLSGRPDKAEAALNEAQGLHSGVGDKPGVALDLSRLGDLHP